MKERGPVIPDELSFGPFIRLLRTTKGWTQSDLANRVSNRLAELSLAGGVTQNAIAQYEGEKIFPELEKIAALGDVLGEDYFALILRIAYSRFMLPKLHSISTQSTMMQEKLEASRLRLLLAGLKRFELVGGVQSPLLEIHQLEAKARMLATAEILGFRGILSWQWNFPALEEFWVCNFDWLDSRSRKLQAVVQHHLRPHSKNRRACRYVYFVRPDDLVAGEGRFARYLSTVEARMGGHIRDAVVPVPVETNELQRIRLDFVVANPHLVARAKAVAFENLRLRGKVQYSFRMDPEALAWRVPYLAEFARDKGIFIGPFRRETATLREDSGEAGSR